MEQIHFAANMWKKRRIDGKQKLKSTAIPTIFPKRKENIESSVDNGQCSATINVSVI